MPWIKRELSHVSWQTWNAPPPPPLSSLKQSPETEHSPQGPNWSDSCASAGPCHSPAVNLQEPSRQANDSNQYIYGHIQIQLLATNHHGLEHHPPRHHTGRVVFLQEDCGGSSDVIRWSVFLAAPIHLYFMFLTNCTKWHNLGVLLPSFAEYFHRCRCRSFLDIPWNIIGASIKDEHGCLCSHWGRHKGWMFCNHWGRHEGWMSL